MKSVLIIDIKTDNSAFESIVQKSIHILDEQGVTYSKICVNHILEAPIALRFAIETFRSNHDKNSKRPDGYMVFGFVSKSEDLETVVYEEFLRSLQDMACYYGLALSHHTHFESQSSPKNSDSIAQQIVYSCLDLIQLKRQLGLQSSHINTP